MRDAPIKKPNEVNKEKSNEKQIGKEKNKTSMEEGLVVNWRLEQWFPDLSLSFIEKLKAFHEILIKFNKTLNLISVNTISNADCIHFADSVIASQLILKNTQAKEIFDIGTGNGFPGIVLSILSPEMKINLVESDQRKAEFLKQVISQLDLKNTQVLIKRIEQLPEKSINCGLSRGFASISKALLITRKQFNIKGEYFHLKSEEWPKEISQIPSQLCSFWEPKLVGEYKLPMGESKYAIVKTIKLAE